MVILLKHDLHTGAAKGSDVSIVSTVRSEDKRRGAELAAHIEHELGSFAGQMIVAGSDHLNGDSENA
jgi:hypothetical protein